MTLFIGHMIDIKYNHTFTGESGVLQAYVGIEYAPLPRDDEIIERPDLIMLRDRE